MKAFFSLEAIISLIFALLFLSVISYIKFFEEDLSLFYLCSDIAILITKNPNIEYIQKIGKEADICIMIDTFSNCQNKAKAEVISFSFPIFEEDKIRKTTLSCFRKQ